MMNYLLKDLKYYAKVNPQILIHSKLLELIKKKKIIYYFCFRLYMH